MRENSNTYMQSNFINAPFPLACLRSLCMTPEHKVGFNIGKSIRRWENIHYSEVRVNSSTVSKYNKSCLGGDFFLYHIRLIITKFLSCIKINLNNVAKHLVLLQNKSQVIRKKNNQFINNLRLYNILQLLVLIWFCQC